MLLDGSNTARSWQGDTWLAEGGSRFAKSAGERGMINMHS
jgi:hypothetical protein